MDSYNETKNGLFNAGEKENNITQKYARKGTSHTCVQGCRFNVQKMVAKGMDRHSKAICIF